MGVRCINSWLYSERESTILAHTQRQLIIMIFLCSLLMNIYVGAYPTYSASYGEGRGAILLSDLRCFGNETRLSDCPSGSVTSCSHAEDAGVRCRLRTSMSTATLMS